MFANIPLAKTFTSLSPGWEDTAKVQYIAKDIDTSRDEDVAPLMQSVYHRNYLLFLKLPGLSDPKACPLYGFSVPSLQIRDYRNTHTNMNRAWFLS